MNVFRRKTLFVAAFVFAAGFAGSAGAQRNCEMCMTTYNICMAQPDAEQWRCALEHNRCAEPIGCPLMPEF
ncbi:MAG: hypothetical protein ACREP7_20870 [Lysobacter sp.]